MDDPNITMEEYVRLEEEKARKCRKVFNCETAKYGKIWYDEDVHDLRSVKTEFPAIVFNDNLSSNETLSCEPTISSLNNNEIDFRISFNESDDEDYTGKNFSKKGYGVLGFDGQEIFVSHAWRRLFEIRAPLVQEFILEFFNTCRIDLHTAEEMAEDRFRAYWLGSERVIPDKGDLSDYWAVPQVDLIQHFWEGQAPEKVTATDLFYLRIMDRREANITYLLAQYLFRHTEGRNSSVRLSGRHFIRCLAHHFGLVSDDGLRGLFVVTHEIPFFDMGKLVKFNIYREIGDDWAWEAPGLKRHPMLHLVLLEPLRILL
ncbi:hypothetical protein Tco_1360632 [Tanacetum coccineum]